MKRRYLALGTIVLSILICFAALSVVSLVECRSLYGQALEAYQSKEYGSALDALHSLVFTREFYSWNFLFLLEKNYTSEAEQLEPQWYLEWSEALAENGNYSTALDKLHILMARYPQYQRDYVETKYIDWHIEQAKTCKNCKNYTIPKGTPKDLEGKAELLMRNDSPRTLDVYMRELASNTRDHISIEGNQSLTTSCLRLFCRVGAIEETLLLPAGSYEIAFDTTFTDPVYGSWTLLGDTGYTICLCIQESPPIFP